MKTWLIGYGGTQAAIVVALDEHHARDMVRRNLAAYNYSEERLRDVMTDSTAVLLDTTHAKVLYMSEIPDA